MGIFAPVGPFASASEQHKVTLARIADTGVDHVCVGDHVSFFIGAGADALINATSLLTHYAELPCYVGLYLIPLRHPVPVARQLASIAELARRAVRRRGAACGTVRRWLVGNLGLASAIQLRGRTGRRAREPCWQGPERL